MPHSATSHRAVRLFSALLIVAVSLSGQTAAPVAAAASVDWRTCAARPVPLPAPRAVDPALASALTAKVTAWQKARRYRQPGLSVAIRWDDGRSFTASAGIGDTISKRAVTPATPFAIASISKSFTASVALLLDHCGIMPLNTRAATLVPEADVRPEVTISQLLLHHSGMSDWLTDKDSRMDFLSRNQNARVTPLTAVQHLLPATPLDNFSYSNSGFTLITIAAERATGTDWKTLLQTLVLNPLGLTETGWGPKVGAARPHMGHKPYGYAGWAPSKAVATVLRGAGDLLSTPRDLARFGELFWGNRLTEGTETIAMNGAAHPGWGSWLYNYGTEVDRTWVGLVRTYGHDGGYSGVTSSLRRIPALGITMAAVANGSPGKASSADDLVQALFKMIDQPPVDANGSPRQTAAERGDPEPPDPPVVLPADYCGDPAPTSPSDALASRWIALGSTDGWTGSTTQMIELPDGRLVIGGVGLTRAAGTAVAGLAVRDPRTGAWQPLASLKTSAGSVGSVYSLAVDTERSILYVAGNFTKVTRGARSVVASGIAQLNLATGIWSAVGKGLTGTGVSVRSLSLNVESGALLVAGRFSRAGGVAATNIALWNPLRKRWAPLGAGLQSDVVTVALGVDGTAYAAGRFTDGVVSQWNPTTKIWSAIGDTRLFSDVPTSLVIDELGHPLIGRGVGWYGDAAQQIEPTAPGGWAALGGGVSYPRRTAWVTAMATLGDGKVALGGYFSKAAGLDAPNLVLWDPITQRYDAIGAGLAIEPDALAASANATLYAATRVRSSAPGGSGGRCIAAWAAQAPGAPANATLTAGRGTIRVDWTLPTDSSAATGWIATATAKGRASRSCAVEGTFVAPVAGNPAHCTITGLAKKVAYTVTLVAWSAPAGPSPRVAVGTVKTLR